ncbi:hypothetical protein [Streptomyces sp. NPDC051286]|uniref:hypothetical protein n=1 Tax=Streptomyces sp. NPDC051286 TaxID=3365647 RepID=UPI0037996660
MKERAQELRTVARRSPRAAKADAESDVLAESCRPGRAVRLMPKWLFRHRCSSQRE